MFTLTLAPPTKGLPSLSSRPLLFLTVKKLVCLSAMVIRFPSNSTQTSFGNFETVERAFGFESEYEACAPAFGAAAMATPNARNALTSFFNLTTSSRPL